MLFPDATPDPRPLFSSECCSQFENLKAERLALPLQGGKILNTTPDTAVATFSWHTGAFSSGSTGHSLLFDSPQGSIPSLTESLDGHLTVAGEHADATVAALATISPFSLNFDITQDAVGEAGVADSRSIHRVDTGRVTVPDGLYTVTGSLVITVGFSSCFSIVSAEEFGFRVNRNCFTHPETEHPEAPYHWTPRTNSCC